MYCWKCGMQMDTGSTQCARCGAQLYTETGQPQPDSTDKALGLLVPINVSGLSIAAGYMGLFAVLLVPAPIALLLGILALKDLKKRPNVSGKGRAIFGVVMGSLCSVFLCIFLFAMMTGGMSR